MHIQLKIQTTADYVEAISAILNLFEANSITVFDAADEPILEPLPGRTPLWQNSWIIGLFDHAINIEQILNFLRARLGEQALLDYSVEQVPRQNWERAWLQHFKPMRFGERLWICPSAYQPPQAEAINIILDPGLAFGTGTHPTTALCLEWLDKNPPQHKTLIDYGCGSGILAIAALKLGAQKVWAIDYDGQALDATHANAKRNQIDENQLFVAPPEKLTRNKVELVLANILAAPLMQLAPTFAGLIQPGGKIVLSGILAEQTASVVNAYKTSFTLAAPKQKEEWILLEGTRHSC